MRIVLSFVLSILFVQTVAAQSLLLNGMMPGGGSGGTGYGKLANPYGLRTTEGQINGLLNEGQQHNEGLGSVVEYEMKSKLSLRGILTLSNLDDVSELSDEEIFNEYLSSSEDGDIFMFGDVAYSMTINEDGSFFFVPLVDKDSSQDDSEIEE